MNDPKVPPQALSSETFEKARRNTLVWCSLTIATLFAQSDTHRIKSSIIGGETTLPAMFIALLFLLLAAFHSIGFLHEKSRIERWQSQYATEHEGYNIEQKIFALFEFIEKSLVDYDTFNREWIDSVNEIVRLSLMINKDGLALQQQHQDLNKRAEELKNAISRLPNLNSETLQLIRQRYTSALTPKYDKIMNVSGAVEKIGYVYDNLPKEPGPSADLKDKLEEIASKLSRLADDISVGERRYFQWYEVGTPIVALVVTCAFWLAALRWPNLPIIIRNAF